MAVVREKDTCWEFADKLDGNKVKCKFCNRVLNGGISRLKHHLSRLPSKGVNPCSKVRDDITEKVRALLAIKEEGKEIMTTKKQRLVQVVAPTALSPSKPLMALDVISSNGNFFPSNLPLASTVSDEENAERRIALFFLENKIDFSVARSPSYQLMINAITKCDYGFTGPSAEMLKTTWVERIKSEVSQQWKDIEKEWATTGCTIIIESWTDNKSKALINFLVSTSSRIFFHKSVDASAYLKNPKYLSDLVDTVIQDFGPENVVQLIVDSSLSYVAVTNHVGQHYGTIFVSQCSAQCLNLILEDFCRVDWVNRCISQAQTITKFIYNNGVMLDSLRKITGGQDLIKSGISKYVSNFLSLQCLLKHKSRVRSVLHNHDYSPTASFMNKPQISCLDIIEDNEFWRTVEECVAVSEPFLRVLREVSGGKPAVGYIYEFMMRAKESIRTYFIMDEEKCKTFLDIVDRRWQNQLHSPLHSAAAFLNPSIQYNPQNKFSGLGTMKEEFYKVIEKLLPTADLRRDMTNQIYIFTKATGMFGCRLAMEARDMVSPGRWWEQYGDSAPSLQRVAIRILSQVCSTCSFQKNWSTFQRLHSDKRNKIDKETLNDLLYINYNLKLARQTDVKCSDNDPLQLDDIDMTSEWVEEVENPSPTTQWLDRLGAVMDGNDLNTRQFSSTLFGPNDHIFGL
ncbi:unnamed protein product [Rhodiola kirilowii]